MRNKLERDLHELIEAKVIDKQTAGNIQQYYLDKKAASNLLFIIFGVIGAMLIGLGVILLVAHNWDTMSNAGKAAVGFLPLIILQVICAYIIYEKFDKDSWRESATVLMMLLLVFCLARKRARLKNCKTKV